MFRTPIARATLVGLVVLAKEAHADERVECAAAYEYTQRSQQRSELLSAAEHAERCARPTCPALLRDECSRWIGEIRQKLPGLMVHVRAADGCTRDAAKIEVSGTSRKDVESESWLVDPGRHDVRVTDPVSGREKTESIDFAPGERRDIDVDFAPPDAVCGGKSAPPPPRPQPTLPRTSLMIASIGGGLVLLGATLGVVGAVKRGDLADCKPNCSSDRIDAVRPFFVVGDVLAGVGLLTIAAAAVTYFTLDRPAMNRPPSTGWRVTPGRFAFSF
jgi:hypothetical protein